MITVSLKYLKNRPLRYLSVFDKLFGLLENLAVQHDNRLFSAISRLLHTLFHYLLFTFPLTFDSQLMKIALPHLSKQKVTKSKNSKRMSKLHADERILKFDPYVAKVGS